MQSPADSLSFILQRERFVSAYFVPRSLRFTRGEIYRETFASILFSRLSPPRPRIYSLGWESQSYPYFFRPRRFRRWFLSAKFAGKSDKLARARNRKRGKCVAHETDMMKTERANYTANFLAKCERKLSDVSIRRSRRDDIAIDISAMPFL